MAMSAEDTFWRDIAEKYTKVTSIIDTKAPVDPPSEPYKSKYEARDVLLEMKALLCKRSDERDTPDIRENAMLSSVYLILGTVSMEVDENSTAEEYLMKSLEVIEGHKLHQDNILCTMATLNQLGLLWTQRDDFEKALSFLKESEQLYTDFKKLDLVPTDCGEMFTGNPPKKELASQTTLEKTYTLTIYYAAQVYKFLGDLVKSAVYCHTTLKRQLDTGGFDKLDWATNSATLSQYLVEQNAFGVALHHLAAASHMLDQEEEILDEIISEDEVHLARVHALKLTKSNVARCWIKYDLVLLTVSRDRLMSEDESPPVLQPPPSGLLGLVFSLDTEKYEKRVGSSYILTIEDAVPHFRDGLEWVGKAKAYYSLDEHASDYIGISQDESQLYSALAFFEEEEEKQVIIHKKRLIIVELVVAQVNPTYYLNECRQLWLEIGETCSTIVETKQSVINKRGNPSEKTVKKFNETAKKGIDYFNKFIDSYRDRRNNKLPPRVPSDDERAYLMAFVYSGRLHAIIIPSERSVQIENTRNSLQCYRTVVEYCERNPSIKDDIKQEFAICKDMVTLLPLKLSKLSARMDSTL